MTAFLLQGAYATDIATSTTADKATVQYFEGQTIPTISNEYLNFAQIDFHTTGSTLKDVLVEIMPAHTTTARDFGINVENYHGMDYGTRGGPSRIAVSFSKGDDLIPKFDAFVKKQFGEESVFDLSGYRWTTSYVAKNSHQYSCISFAICDYENVMAVFAELVKLFGLSEMDKNALTEVYERIKTCMEKS